MVSRKRKNNLKNNKKQNKKTAPRADYFSFKAKLISALSGAAVIIFSIVGNAIHNNYTEIQGEFKKQSDAVLNLSYSDNVLYDDCSDNPANDAVVKKTIDKLRINLEEAVTKQHSMGRIVSLRTYCTIHEFTRWNNQLQRKRNSKACQTKLPDQVQIYTWRNQVLQQIREDQLSHANAISAIVDYFSISKYYVFQESDCKILGSKNYKPDFLRTRQSTMYPEIRLTPKETKNANKINT